MLRSTIFALALTVAAAAPALADDMKPRSLQPEQLAVLSMANSAQVRSNEAYAMRAYQANINPLSFMLEKVGPYDLEDAYSGPNGYALPGWEALANPSSVGGDSSGS